MNIENQKCTESINKLRNFLDQVQVFLQVLKCPYAKELLDNLEEINYLLDSMPHQMLEQKCTKCNCDTCECILNDALEQLNQ